MIFASGVYRLVLFALMPAAIVGLQVGLSVMGKYTGRGWGSPKDLLPAVNYAMFAAAMLMTWAEVLMDNWAFEGIAAKSGASPEFLKSSPRGKRFVKEALQASMLRLFLENGAILILGRFSWAVMSDGFGELFAPRELALVLAVLFCQYFSVMATLLIARHFSNFQVNKFAAGIAYIVLIMLFVLCGLVRYVMLPIAAVLSVAISAVSQWKIMKRVEESYYDQKF